MKKCIQDDVFVWMRSSHEKKEVFCKIYHDGDTKKIVSYVEASATLRL